MGLVRRGAAFGTTIKGGGLGSGLLGRGAGWLGGTCNSRAGTDDDDGRALCGGGSLGPGGELGLVGGGDEAAKMLMVNCRRGPGGPRPCRLEVGGRHVGGEVADCEGGCLDVEAGLRRDRQRRASRVTEM